MVISPGHSYLIAIFGAETELVSQLWHCTSNEIDLTCLRLSEVSMHPLRCQMFNMVWIAIKSNGHFSLGVGRVLHRNVIILVKLTSEYQMIRELRVDHASTENQKDENHLAKLRIFRSFDDNRCIFHETELSFLQPCGDGYITDEGLCHECGCCFYPGHLLGHRITKDQAMCYRPVFSKQHSVPEASLSSCFRSFHDIIKNVSFAVRPSGKIKLFQNVTFLIAIQNVPTNVRVKLNFGDGLLEENVVLARTTQAPGEMSFARSDFYFCTVVHQYSRQAQSGVVDCLQKSCSGYIATLEITGRGEDRLEVLQFVEGGDAPFKAQIYTRAESNNGNVTICAVLSKLEVPISLVQASMEFDGSTVNVSLKENLNVPAWLSNHSEPGDYAVILNHVFNTKNLTVIKLHLYLPNAVNYTVETRLPAKSLQQQIIGLYDVQTDKARKSLFKLYENITFLLRIQLSTDVIAAVSFADGKILQNIKPSGSIPFEDIPEWAVPLTRNSSIRKTLVFHRYTNPGKYTVRLEFSVLPNRGSALFNETEVHVSSFTESLGKVVLIANTSMTINPYDTVSFIILVENIVGNMTAVLKLDEDSASLHARFTRSSKVEYDGVWYNAVTVTYSFYKPGRHNVTLTIRDGYNSSNQAPSVAMTEIMVSRIQDAIGEVGLYVDPRKLNLINIDVEFCLLVQRHFRHMRLRASMGDGHSVDFIRASREQQAPSWMTMVPALYMKGVFSHAYSSAGTYQVEAIAEDSLKSRADYSTALIRVVIHDPLSDAVTLQAESLPLSDAVTLQAESLALSDAVTLQAESLPLSDTVTLQAESLPLSDTVTLQAENISVSVRTGETLGNGTSRFHSTDESRQSEVADPSATVQSSYHALATDEVSDKTGLRRDSTELGYGLTTADYQSTETDTDRMSHSIGSSPIGGFAASGSWIQYTAEIDDDVEHPDSDSDSSGLVFAASSMHRLDSSYWSLTDTDNEYRSNFADLTAVSSDQRYPIKGTDVGQRSNLEGEFSYVSDVLTRKNKDETWNESDVGEGSAAFTASGIDQTPLSEGNDTVRCSGSELQGLDCTVTNTSQQRDLNGGSYNKEKHELKSEFLEKESSTASIDQHNAPQGTEDHSVDDYGSTRSNMQSPRIEIDAGERSGLSTNISAVRPTVSQQHTIKETITDEDAEFPSALPESDIHPETTTLMSHPSITKAADVDEDYHSTITGDTARTFISGTGLDKTTMDRENILLATSGVENQASTNKSDSVEAGYTIIVNGKYEDTVSHASEDYIQMPKFSAAETTESKSEKKAETSGVTSEDNNDYTIKTIKYEKAFSEETAEVLLVTPSHNDDLKTSVDLPADEQRAQETVLDNEQNFSLTTYRELNVDEARNTHLSRTNDVMPPDSKKTKELPDENQVPKTATDGNLDTLELTLGGTANDDNTAFSKVSYTGVNHIDIGEDNTKYVRRPNGSREHFVKTTTDPDSGEGNLFQSTEMSSVSESSQKKNKDDEDRHTTNFIDNQDAEGQTDAERALNVTLDKEEAADTYRSVTNDKISRVTTAYVKKSSYELHFGGEWSSHETSYHRSIKDQIVNGLHSLSPGSEEETLLPEDEAIEATVTIIKSIVPDTGITPSDLGTNELKEITLHSSKDTYLAENDRKKPATTTFKSITHGLDTKLHTVAAKTLTQDTTQLKSGFVSRKTTDIPVIHRTSPDTWKLKSDTSVSGKEMVNGVTSSKPFDTTLKVAEHENISSPNVPRFHVAVYVDPAGVVNFLVLLEDTTKNLSSKIFFGDNIGENITFDLQTSDFPDWLLERPAEDSNFQQAIRTHAYLESNITYEARITVYDDVGNGVWKTFVFKPQSCTETESVLKVNGETSETCFQLYIKDPIHLSIHLPFCLLTRNTRSRWIVSKIRKQGNDTEYLVKDILSSPIAYDVFNYTIRPFTLDVASYMIEAHVSSEDEFGTIVGLSKTSTCISLQPTRLQAVAFASQQQYTINETIVIDATSTKDPSQPFSNSGLELLWSCSTKSPTKDTDIGESKSAACFADDSAVLGFSGTILAFPATHLAFTFLPANYFLTVMVRKSGREPSSTTVQIALVVGARPSCNISCLYNCKINFDVSQLLALQVSCSNCHRTEQLSYLWRFMASKPSNKLAGISSSEVLMECNTARCAVKAGVLSTARFFEEYQINVRVSRVDGTYSWVSYPIRITTLVGEELPSLDLNSNLGYMKKEQDEKESDSMGPLIGIIIGVVAGLLALAGTVYLVKRHRSLKAKAAPRKTAAGGNEPPNQTEGGSEAPKQTEGGDEAPTQSTEADTSAKTSA